MKALILIGGFGTRLRPLTFTKPKPLICFGDKPILCHQIEALVKVGVKEIILAVSQQPDALLDELKLYEQKYEVKIIISIEQTPLGTAGPLNLAKEHLLHENPEGLFFMFNADVICEYPLQSMLDFHKQHGKEGTILVTKVEDPSKYGVVVSNPEGLIQSFVEKPTEFVSNKINTGLYLFNTSIIDRVPAGEPTSIERKTFPMMVSDNQIYSMVLQGFWMDIGQPKDFIKGAQLFLQNMREKDRPLASGSNIRGNVWIHQSAKVDKDALIGPNVFIGEGCQIGPGARIRDSVLLEGTKVEGFSLIDGGLIGWRNVIKRWARIEPTTITGDDVQIEEEAFLYGIIVCPNKQVAGKHPEPKIIM